MTVGEPHKFGWCLFKRHEHCKVTLENGTTCNCDCENHGSKYTAINIDTPMHRMLLKAGKDNGYLVDDFDDKIEESETEETIEDLEKKRAADEKGINT